MGDEIVAEKDGGLVAAKVIDGGAFSPQLGLVEDIVVDQRGHVNHFDNGGEDGVGISQFAAGFSSQEHEGGPEHFAAEAGDVANEVVDAGEVGGQLLGEELFDGPQLLLDRFVHERQCHRCSSPWALVGGL